MTTAAEPALPHNNGAKTDRIDLGLAILSAVTPPRVPLSPKEIAAWCGCTPAMITSIEARAWRRLRQKVRQQFGSVRFDAAGRREFMALHFPPST